MTERSFPTRDDLIESDADPFRSCIVCRREFRLTDREDMGLDFLKEHHRLHDIPEDGVEEAPIFKVRELCLDCIRKIGEENIRSELAALIENMSARGDNGEIIPNPADSRLMDRIRDMTKLLPSSGGLRSRSLTGIGEQVFQERLPHISDYLKILFSDFPGIERNEFFAREMRELFDAPDGYLPAVHGRGNTDEDNMENLRQESKFKKVLGSKQISK